MNGTSIFVQLHVGNRLLRVNPNFIVSIQPVGQGTEVQLSAGAHVVNETPDEIEELIKQAAVNAVGIAASMASDLCEDLDLDELGG